MALAEEAADVRGSTPTDCARRLVPDRRDVQYELATVVAGIEGALTRRLDEGRAVLDHVTSLCETEMRQWIRTLGDRLQSVVRLLTSLDPNAVVARGYALVADARGKILTSVTSLAASQSVMVTLRDGSFDAAVQRIHDKGKGKKD